MRPRVHCSALLFCVIFIIVIPINNNQIYFEQVSLSDLENTPFLQAYETHTSIYIDGDDNLTAWGFPGSGSVENPYLIDGYNFTMDIPAIYVMDISLHLLINGCWIQSTGEQIGNGIYFENVTAGRIENCIIIDKSIGITITQSDSCLISDVEITGTTNHAIDISTSVNCVVSDSYIHHVSNIGIYDSSTLTEISDTVIHNAGHGIYSVGDTTTIDGCEIHHNGGYGIRNEAWYSQITNNRIYICSSNGIYEYTARYDTFSGNQIFNNGGAAIWFQTSEYSEFIGNTVFGNAGGIIFTGGFSGASQIYDNEIGWNGIHNALDDSSNGNNWDDTVDTGNAWSDYSGTGTYSISGEYGGTDHYPTILSDSTSPSIITSPTDVFMSDMESKQISWELGAEEYPKYYTILINGSGAAIKWDGTDIDYTLEDLSPGIYNYTLLLEDCAGNQETDTLFVEVYGFTLSSPSDIIIESGTVGNIIEWTAIGGNPDHYEIYVNGSLEEYADWVTWVITYNVDTLLLGFYEVELRIYNSTGYYLSDTVFVQVIDTVNPVINELGIYYVELGSTLQLEWITEDLNPDTLTLWKNGSSYFQSTWEYPVFGIDIICNELGTWNFTLEIIDLAGNTASSTAYAVVRNTVTTTTITTTSTTTTTTTTTATTTTTSTVNETRLDQLEGQITIQYMVIGTIGVLTIISLSLNALLLRRVNSKKK